MPSDKITIDPSAYLGPDEQARSAVTRLTKTPIKFKRFNDPSQSGNYNGPSYLTSLLTLPKILASIRPKGEIQVDPYSPDNTNMGKTVNHEEIHSLLNQYDPLSQVTPDQDFMKAISPYLKSRGGDNENEAPAYLGAFDSSQTPVPQELRDAFVQDFANKLAGRSQEGAKIYRRIAQQP